MDSTVRSSKWKRRSINHQTCRFPILLTFFLLLFCFAFYISSNTLVSTSVLTSSGDTHTQSPLFPQCANAPGGEKFLWYAPHSGFSNQLSEFKNAILMAAILNRTLIIPPVFDHHAVALGSCPKFRVLNPSDLRFKAWNHTIQLIRDRRKKCYMGGKKWSFKSIDLVMSYNRLSQFWFYVIYSNPQTGNRKP